jgi:carbonic anhydrase/acetyltransferase-like protein (isoleucine patch superfamily)
VSVPSINNPSHEVEQSLKRLTDALSHPSGTTPLADPESPSALKKGAQVGLAASIALIAVLIATGQYGLIPVAVVALIASGLLLSTRGMRALVPEADPSRPSIGMSASVAKDAIVEPGAVIGTGVHIGRGAIIRRGAVIRVGANVAEGAVIEENAVISWGVNVGARAVVGAGAVVSSGTNIGKGTRVPAGMRLPPGTNWKGGDAGEAAAAPAIDKDPRSDRIDTLCTRLEAELSKSPESVRVFLGPSGGTIRELRRAFYGLLQREQTLRLEAAPSALAALEKERTAVALKLDAASDSAVRKSLESALAAIDEQRRQRDLMARQADRLEAEITRLLWTLDAMGTQLARARTAGAELSAADQELGRSVKQLHDEISAIADALDGIAEEELRAQSGGPAISPVAPIAANPDASPVVRERTRL